MSETIEEAILKFVHELNAITGENNPVVKIAITPRVMDRLVQGLHLKNHHYFRPEGFGELKVMGVQILARQHDNF